MRERDVVETVYLASLAQAAHLEASRLTALLLLCNFASVLLLYIITSLPGNLAALS
jgi:hypothetical protein